MEKHIYSLFTSENGIRMSADVLKYISERVGTAGELEVFLASFRTRFNTSTIDREQVDRIISDKQTVKDFFLVHPAVYRPHRLSHRYECFKRLMGSTLTPISLLEDGSKSVIFGIFYKNRSGTCVLEDDHGITGLDLSGCRDDMFLFENMFLAAEGRREGGVFAVEGLIRPPVRVYSGRNNFLEQKSTKICLFGCFTDQHALVDQVVDRHRPGICILSACVPCKETYKSPLTHVITCPCRCRASFLPDRSDRLSATNPFTLELHGLRIAFMDHDIFRHKAGGVFCNKEPLESFLRSFLSQYSYNPFSSVDLSIDVLPNVFILSQEFYPFVLDIDGVQVVSLLSLRDGAFGVIDTETRRIEIVTE